MKCFNHVDVDATATCQGCGKGLCNKCATRFNMIYCESCLLSHNKSVANQMYSGLIVTLIIFFGVIWFFGGMRVGNGESFGYAKAAGFGLLLAFTYWGWKFLTDRFPRLTMGSGLVWLFYFFAKFTAAYFIGIIVGPYQIYIMFKEIRAVRKTHGQIMRGEL